jgi:PAS domain S-box-containing protein
MIESSLDSLVAISPDGRITNVNEATIKATGILHEELIGTAFSRDRARCVRRGLARRWRRTTLPTLRSRPWMAPAA